MHIELLLEEPSAEAFLQGFLHHLLPVGTTWTLIVFQGKSDLLKNLAQRLKGYRNWMPQDWKIVVLVDEDRTDCMRLKEQMENAANAAGFITKTKSQGKPFTVLNRIVVEELEAWYFGDLAALATAYPGVSKNLSTKAAFRNPDAIGGGTWETLERVLRRAGHCGGGFSKIEVARKMALHMDVARNTSASFQCFAEGLAAL
jgi:hypothetical protein